MQKESTNSLLANLPCRDKNNFSKANLYDTTARNAREFPVYVDCSDDQNDTAQRIVSEQANVFFKYIHKQMELKQTTESLRNKRKTDPIVTINPKIPKLQ